MKIKKLIASLLAVTVMGVIIPTFSAVVPSISATASTAEDYTEEKYGDFTINKYSDHVEIIEYKGESIEVEIPSKVDGLPVTFIGSQAFSKCTSLTLITIPDSVTSIGSYAFWECTSLTSVTIPDSVKIISRYSFWECTSLTSITIPNSVTSIGDSAFETCTNLASITIGNSVTSIGVNAFYETPWLENKQKENPLVVVNGILIDGTVCSGDVTLPNSITNISDSAFFHCKNLTSVTIPDSVTNIGDSAFEVCINLTSVTIPGSVTNIGNNAFENCASLTSVTLPDSVENIGDHAFSHCKNLTSVTISDSVKSINRFTFYDTPWLENKQKENPLIVVNGIIIDGTACSGDVAIPNSVTNIGVSAFENCESLTSVTIPDSVLSIDNYAFRNCPSLSSITILNLNCMIADDPFTISNSMNFDSETQIYSGVIKGYSGSTAESYAKTYNRAFKSLDGSLLYGDVDGDGKITANDASLVLSEYAVLSAGKTTFTTEQTALADVDGDDKITANDASNILMFYAYLSGNGMEKDIKVWLNNLNS